MKKVDGETQFAHPDEKGIGKSSFRSVVEHNAQRQYIDTKTRIISSKFNSGREDILGEILQPCRPYAPFRMLLRKGTQIQSEDNCRSREEGSKDGMSCDDSLDVGIEGDVSEQNAPIDIEPNNCWMMSTRAT